MIADIVMFAAVAWICWRGYRFRRPWLSIGMTLLMHHCQGRSFWWQWFVLAPLLAGWLLLCHWVNTHGWHGLAAGGILFAMTLGLQAMRSWEEQQKQERHSCHICD